MKLEKMYSAIVITCSDQESAKAFHTEIIIRQKKMLIHPETVILCVVDPKPNIGSGGATLNAILHITEHISAIRGYTVISQDVLQDLRILILHMGTSTPYSACSAGFLPLPAFVENIGATSLPYSGLATQFDLLLQTTINVLAKDSPPGIWVCSCDRMITLSPDTTVDWNVQSNVRLFTVPVDITTAADKHGVAKISKEGLVEDIIYKGSQSSLQSCLLNESDVPVVCGLLFMETRVVDILLNLSVVPPLDTCTYLGLDAGTRPTANRPLVSEKEHMYRDDINTFVLSLFFDVLLCMSKDITKEAYVSGKRSGIYGTEHRPGLEKVDIHLRRQAREVLWDTLHEIEMKAEILHRGEFIYVSHDPAIIHDLLLHCPYRNSVETSLASIKFKKRASSLSLISAADDGKYIAFVNSIANDVTIGDRCVIMHSCIEGDYHVGNNSLMINIETSDLQALPVGVHLPDDIVLERLHLKLNHGLGSNVGQIILMFGINDKLKQQTTTSGCTVFNQSWDEFFKRTTILPTEVWSPDIPVSKRCLLNARLFPLYHPKEKINIMHLLWLQGSNTNKYMANHWRTSWKLSMEEILDLANPSAEFSWRRELYFKIGQKRMEKALKSKLDIWFIPFIQSCIMDGYFEQTLAVLDNVAKTSTDPAVISRTFACIADVLGAKAGGVGGLRSGPAANYLWKDGLDMLKNNKVKDAVDYMAKQRVKWFGSPDFLVRAARHYEGAFQVQVRKAVATARQFISLDKGEMVPLKTWVRATCPGRLDLSGGWSDTPPLCYEQARSDIAGTWSDTPPICYEQGGAVITLGITIDGKKPIGCDVQRIPEPKIILIMGKNNGMKIECEQFEDLMNFSQPNMPGALLKAAFFCAELLPLHKQQTSLADCLMNLYGSGFVLNTWSNLPHGSGLGTSSILAGAVISALWTAVGWKHDVDSVVHAVLDLEQMLTTGGGWQDQVGGLYPGVKVGSSANKLPLHVQTKEIEMPPGFKEILEKHLIVVFTGKTRLARNMLQDVLRNWNARSPEIVDTAKQLITNANQSMAALKKGDIEEVGRCLNECWKHKKLMAHGCEPNVVKAIMEQLRPHVYGQCLAGAGGGGFMYLITKEEHAFDIISNELKKVPMTERATVHYAQIDEEGLKVKVDSTPNEDVY